MAPYHILIVIISSVIPENLVLLTKSEQSGPKSAHIRPTIWQQSPEGWRYVAKYSNWMSRNACNGENGEKSPDHQPLAI